RRVSITNGCPTWSMPSPSPSPRIPRRSSPPWAIRSRSSRPGARSRRSWWHRRPQRRRPAARSTIPAIGAPWSRAISTAPLTAGARAEPLWGTDDGAGRSLRLRDAAPEANAARAAPQLVAAEVVIARQARRLGLAPGRLDHRIAGEYGDVQRARHL